MNLRSSPKCDTDPAFVKAHIYIGSAKGWRYETRKQVGQPIFLGVVVTKAREKSPVSE